MKIGALTNSEIESRLKRAGVSPTAQRIAICRYVLRQTDHPTAEEVKRWVDKSFPKMSMATVYNTLGILVKSGLLKEIKFPHMESAVYDCNIEDHIHFIDDRSGQIVDLGHSKMELSKDINKRFIIQKMDVVIRGKRRKEG